MLLCYVVAFNKMKDVNPWFRDTAVLLRGHCSNGLVKSVYRKAEVNKTVQEKFFAYKFHPFTKLKPIKIHHKFKLFITIS